MPKFKHYIKSEYGISEICYREKEEHLTGIEQENKFSDDMCRDVLRLIIKQIEK